MSKGVPPPLVPLAPKSPLTRLSSRYWLRGGPPEERPQAEPVIQDALDQKCVDPLTWPQQNARLNVTTGSPQETSCSLSRPQSFADFINRRLHSDCRAPGYRTTSVRRGRAARPRELLQELKRRPRAENRPAPVPGPRQHRRRRTRGGDGRSLLQPMRIIRADGGGGKETRTRTARNPRAASGEKGGPAIQLREVLCDICYLAYIESSAAGRSVDPPNAEETYQPLPGGVRMLGMPSVAEKSTAGGPAPGNRLARPRAFGISAAAARSAIPAATSTSTITVRVATRVPFHALPLTSNIRLARIRFSVRRGGSPLQARRSRSEGNNHGSQPKHPPRCIRRRSGDRVTSGLGAVGVAVLGAEAGNQGAKEEETRELRGKLEEGKKSKMCTIKRGSTQSSDMVGNIHLTIHYELDVQPQQKPFKSNDGICSTKPVSHTCAVCRVV
ncbi:unnamed protein product [Diplocarpon coronariae]